MWFWELTHTNEHGNIISHLPPLTVPDFLKTAAVSHLISWTISVFLHIEAAQDQLHKPHHHVFLENSGTQLRPILNHRRQVGDQSQLNIYNSDQSQLSIHTIDKS